MMATESLDLGCAQEGLKERLQRVAARGLRLATMRARNTGPVVSFTFDDVPKTSFTHGAGILDEFGAHGTFYISGGLCGTSSAERNAICPDECIDLHARGHEIGCHTFSHRHMRDCTPRLLRDEIESNQAYFRSLDRGIHLTNFAFPYNAPTISTKMLLQKHFQSCRGGVPGLNVGAIDFGFLRAVEMRAGTSEAEMKTWIDEAVRHNAWLIFFSHDVTEGASRWGVSPALLRATVAHAKARGCDIASVREALALVGGAQDRSESAPS